VLMCSIKWFTIRQKCVQIAKLENKSLKFKAHFILIIRNCFTKQDGGLSLNTLNNL